MAFLSQAYTRYRLAAETTAFIKALRNFLRGPTDDDTLHELALLCGNGEWVPRTLFDRMTVLYQKCADEERTTNVKAIVRFNQVATEHDLDVELFQVVYNHRCDAKQIGVLREWGGFKTALLGEDSTRASVYWTLNIVKAAADREPNTLTINPFVQYFYALATGIGVVGFALIVVPGQFNLLLDRKYALDALERGIVESLIWLGSLIAIPIAGRVFGRKFREDPDSVVRTMGTLIMAAGVVYLVVLPIKVLGVLIVGLALAQALISAALVAAPMIIAAVSPYRIRTQAFSLLPVFIFLMGGFGGGAVTGGATGGLCLACFVGALSGGPALV